MMQAKKSHKGYLSLAEGMHQKNLQTNSARNLLSSREEDVFTMNDVCFGRNLISFHSKAQDDSFIVIFLVIPLHDSAKENI